MGKTDAPLFTSSDTENFPEGSYVFHDQLGVGVVLRPESWSTVKTPAMFDQVNRVHVLFLNYTPVVLAETKYLTPVKMDQVRWNRLLNESFSNRAEPEWYAPSGMRCLPTDGDSKDDDEEDEIDWDRIDDNDYVDGSP